MNSLLRQGREWATPAFPMWYRQLFINTATWFVRMTNHIFLAQGPAIYGFVWVDFSKHFEPLVIRGMKKPPYISLMPVAPEYRGFRPFCHFTSLELAPLCLQIAGCLNLTLTKFSCPSIIHHSPTTLFLSCGLTYFNQIILYHSNYNPYVMH